ncbi:MAG: HAMP domain-containing protein [Betaproteobacteria bacterium]|nr:MAG: HAMP domain-containing protein [Betaproteobacteria bacterium]
MEFGALIQVLGASVIFGILASVGLFFVINPGLEAERYFIPILATVSLGILFFLGLLIRQLIRLVRNVRQRIFGSGLVLRHFRQLALMALLPGLALFGVSVAMLFYSVHHWFEVQVEVERQALSEFRDLVLEDLRRSQIESVKQIGRRLAVLPANQHERWLTALSQDENIENIAIYDARRTLVAGREMGYALRQEPPSELAFKTAVQTGIWSVVEPAAEANWQIRVLYRVEPERVHLQPFYLYIQRAVDASLSASLDRLDARSQKGREEVLRASREMGILQVVILTLTLILSLSVAMSLAMMLSERWVSPLRDLGRGQRAVAKGEYRQLSEDWRENDELGQLVRGFNVMSASLERNGRALQQGKAYLEDLLGNLSTAVVTLDAQLKTRLVNVRAETILSYPESQLSGMSPREWGLDHSALRTFGEAIQGHFDEMVAAPDKTQWQEPHMEYRVGDVKHILLVRGAVINAGGAPEYALAFDDITHLLRAQKEAAWGEVARRLAHEVKNPLTPIQLSIEQLQARLEDSLEPKHQAMLNRATAAIVQQVDAIRTLVDEFSRYARIPTPVIHRVDINNLVREVMALYTGVGVSVDLAEDLPAVGADRSLLNRVLVNLIKNALEAVEHEDDKQVVVRTSRVENMACLCVEDNGPGFGERQMAHLFEPYATTKPRGSGLGLPIVKRIIDDHHGQIEVHNVTPHGAAIRILLPVLEET